MPLPRRSFLAASLAASAVPRFSLGQPETPKRAVRPLRIGVSTYSFWHFKGDKPDLHTCIDDAARLGFDGVEILHHMMPTEDNAFCQSLKHRALQLALDGRSPVSEVIRVASELGD